MVMRRNNNTLENHEQIILNKDDDIGGSQISVMWQCISITIYHLLNKFICVKCMHASSFVHFLELLMHAF